MYEMKPIQVKNYGMCTEWKINPYLKGNIDNL